jgi:quercetin dioxygenase-like cupin family protein
VFFCDAGLQIVLIFTVFRQALTGYKCRQSKINAEKIMYKYFSAPSESPFPAVPMEYAWATITNARLAPGPHDGLKSRDLLLHEASNGQMGSLHIAAEREGEAPFWVAPEGSVFAFLYVLSGTLILQTGDGGAVTLRKGDSVSQDVLTQGQIARWSADFTGIEITAPARNSTVETVELLKLGPKARETRADALETRISRDRPGSFVPHGLRKFMAYRDLGTLDETDRRIHIHVVRAIDTPTGGTGWHVHSMSQIFYVLRGWVDIAVDEQGVKRMVAGDAMCIANGMRHNVFRFSPDYDVLEMCLPGDYSTVPTPTPEDMEVGVAGST